jgi:thiamine biosynthesis lipoprotein
MSSIHPCHQLEISRFLMACEFAVLLNSDGPNDAGDAAMEALDRVEWLEQLLSVYRPDSELSRLNRTAFAVEQSVSPDMFALLNLALEIHRATGGCFDITAHSLTEAWGFARRQGRMPTEQQLADAMEQVGSHHISIDTERRTVRYLRSGLRVNSGGIGKGYALDRAAEFFRRRNVHDFFIHGGKSSILASGHRRDLDSNRGWKVAVNHPEQARIQLGELTLVDTALGTSGPANQFFYYNGVRYGHIIDPRTGQPASGILSVTVLHPSACYADALATGLFVMGIDKAVEYCEKRPDTGLLAVLPTRKSSDVEIVTCNLGSEIWRRAR